MIWLFKILSNICLPAEWHLTMLRLRSSYSYGSIGRRDFNFHQLRSLATLRTPLQLTRISCKSSWIICRQVYLGHPLLLAPSCIHCIASFAGLSGGSHSICHDSDNVSILTLTIFDRSSMPGLIISNVISPWDAQYGTHLWRASTVKTSNMCETILVPFHVSAA